VSLLVKLLSLMEQMFWQVGHWLMTLLM
jgi:hypothetical protein